MQVFQVLVRVFVFHLASEHLLVIELQVSLASVLLCSPAALDLCAVVLFLMKSQQGLTHSLMKL